MSELNAGLFSIGMRINERFEHFINERTATNLKYRVLAHLLGTTANFVNLGVLLCLCPNI